MRPETEVKELKAKEWALECSILVLFIVALAGILAGAETYVAVLRGAAAAAVVAVAGRFPARVAIEALEATQPAEAPAQAGPAAAATEVATPGQPEEARRAA